MATISIASVSITGMGFQNCVILILPSVGAPHTYGVSITVVESVTFVTYALLAHRFVAFVDLNKIIDRIGGEGDFVAGFLLGGALFGSAAYIFAPKIRKALRNEGENGFLRPKGPMYEGYYDDHEGGLEKTRHSLNEKIGQLNSAIDNVYSRLRGGKKMPPIPVESEADEFIA
ncbi:hypothetical protein RHSIM_Rhsim09G0213800 [Rhododendron simsii]|uniref:Uncharacterized protein n=1 Tax=Rhododendron simsii TaxID=118357 RepID=A0A834GED9_RHOSS|nr:hypothetical protein RHSIM_Rhsim09G0213800 [Rhododendron simsii]